MGKVVLKKLRDSNSIEDNVRKSLRHEAAILTKLQHANIVELFESRFDSRCCGLFLEYVKYGPVDDFLKQFDVNTAWKIQTLVGIVSAMCYLHKENIVHGDLKCQNILIGKHFQVKVCDFGFAKMYKLSKATETSTLKGTLAYIAPEYFIDPKIAKTEKFDVYSFAISAWEIFYEKTAYYHVTVREALSVFVERGERPKMTDNDDMMPEELKKVIRDSWQKNEKERPNFESIKVSVISIQLEDLQPSMASIQRVDFSNFERIRPKIKDHLLLLWNELIENMNPLANSKASGDFKRHTESAYETDGTTYDSRESNLIDMLFDEDCISVIDKKDIQRLNSINTKNEALLKLVMDGSMETYGIFMRFLTETNQISTKIMKGEFEEIHTERERGKGSVFAITWMRGKIYVVWQRSNIISVYRQAGSSCELLKPEEIDNPEFGQPWDMTSSEEEGCLFISDPDEKCLWKIQTGETRRDMNISNHKTDGRPKGISFRSNVLVALVQKAQWHLNRYQADNMDELSSINLQTTIGRAITQVEHAVETSTSNIVILYKSWTLTDSNERRNVHFIREMTIEGNSIKKLYPPMITSFWISALHLAIDENDNVLIADTDHKSIVLLDPKLEWGLDIIKKDKTGEAVVPRRLCYVQQRKILLVAHGMELSGSFSIYSLK